MEVWVSMPTNIAGSQRDTWIRNYWFVFYNKLSLTAELLVGQIQRKFYRLNEKLMILIPGRLISDENIMGYIMGILLWFLPVMPSSPGSPGLPAGTGGPKIIWQMVHTSPFLPEKTPRINHDHHHGVGVTGDDNTGKWKCFYIVCTLHDNRHKK